MFLEGTLQASPDIFTVSGLRKKCLNQQDGFSYDVRTS